MSDLTWVKEARALRVNPLLGELWPSTSRGLLLVLGVPCSDAMSSTQIAYGVPHVMRCRVLRYYEGTLQLSRSFSHGISGTEIMARFDQRN
eukprot:2520211-Rhodomonas_salina.1